MFTKQEIKSDATFKASPCSFDFNFACKGDWVTTTTCKCYCPLVITLPLPIVSKNSILNEAELLDLFLKTLPCTKTISVLCENQYFFLFWNVAMSIESHCFSLLIFTVWWSIFDQPFRQMIPLSCFYGSSQQLFKVKITCERVNFIKK